MPVVSVVIPTFQRRELVRQAVASALAQTVADVEVIVVDDGSTDGTREALEGLDPRVRYVWQENRGASAARNEGIRRSAAAVVAFLDSDDRWLPDHLAVLGELLARHRGAVLASTAPRFSIGGRARPGQARVVDATGLVAAETLPGCPSGVAVRRAELVEAGGFDERLLVFEDRDLWLRLSRRGPFVLLDRRTVLRGFTRGSLRERGTRNGAYLDAYELSAERELAELGALPAGPRRDAATQAARARLRLALALRALAAGDLPRARADLAAACRESPALSGEPELVARRLGLTTHGRGELVRRLVAVARLWPDPEADTALYLRAHAALGAIGAGCPGEAVRVLAGWPLSRTPAFARRTWPAWRRVGRRAIQSRLRRGHESPDVVSLPGC